MSRTIMDLPHTVYVDKLKTAYRTSPTTWLSLPNCKHIKLAMTNEKGTRHTREPDELIEHRVKGEVELLMASKVPVDIDSIFDEGTFENVSKPLVILVEGAFQSGKSTLAYHYCQKWANGNLEIFDLVALVNLRHPAVHSAGMILTLKQLLYIACNYSGQVKTSGVTKSVTKSIREGLKFLLILDGWNDAPTFIRETPDLEHSFLSKLLRSVSSNTTILITSRPDSSVDLHKIPNVKRVEILEFTKESIHVYFREAQLSTQLSSTVLEEKCTRIKGHLAKYPAIESHCYIPLNAAIFSFLLLQNNDTLPLPASFYDMFNQLLLHYIAREVSIRQQRRTLGTISSINDLPRDLKKQLKLISILAYEGLVSEKIVFRQDELLFILPVSSRDTVLKYLSQQKVAKPDEQNLPIMGVLQIIQWTENDHKTISYYFVNHSIQELLAAYHISQMRNDKQVRAFQSLLSKPQLGAVLQFYAALTKLTNRGVSDAVARSDLNCATLLSYIRCFFEAEICNQSLYQKIFQKMNKKLYLANVSFDPLISISVGYFLAFVLRNGRELKVDFYRCGIDDHLFGLMMDELSKHAEPCPGGVLHGVTELNVSDNSIGDSSIAHIVKALSKNTTMTKLNISGCKISDDGAMLLAGIFAANSSLQTLYVINNKVGDHGIAYFASAIKTNCSLKALTIGGVTTTDAGVLSLAEVLTASDSMECLGLSWSSEKPDSTLKKIGEYVSKSTLSKLHLEMNMPASGEAPVTEERAKEWLQCVEVGGKELIQSQENNHLEFLYIVVNYHTTRLYFKNHLSRQLDELHKALDAKTEAIGALRTEISQRKLCFLFYSY